MRPERFLIINADDFGISPAVDHAILTAWKEGSVTSTSVMANIPGAVESAARIKNQYPQLPMGLHLNITTGSPLTNVENIPSLVNDEGRFYSDKEIINQLPDIRMSELRTELKAQAEVLLKAGVLFDHIDYHQHLLALYTPFFEIVREMAQEYKTPVRNPVPASVYGMIKAEGGGSLAAMKEMMRFGAFHPVKAFKLMPRMMPSAFKEQAAQLKAEQIKTPDWFVDQYFGNPGLEKLVNILRQLPEGVSEIMAHPGEVDDQLKQYGIGYIGQREAELATLLDPALNEILAEENISLIDYSAI